MSSSHPLHKTCTHCWHTTHLVQSSTIFNCVNLSIQNRHHHFPEQLFLQLVVDLSLKKKSLAGRHSQSLLYRYLWKLSAFFFFAFISPFDSTLILDSLFYFLLLLDAAFLADVFCLRNAFFFSTDAHKELLYRELVNIVALEPCDPYLTLSSFLTLEKCQK